MKKIFVIVSCLALCVCIFASCGNKPAETTVAPPATTVAPQTTVAPETPLTPDAAALKALDDVLAAIKNGEYEGNPVIANSVLKNEEAEMLDAIMTNFDYTLGTPVVTDDGVTVPAEIKMVNFYSTLMAYYTEMMNHSDEADWDADFSYFYGMLKSADATVDTYNADVKMVKDGETWVIGEGNEEFYAAFDIGLGAAIE